MLFYIIERLLVWCGETLLYLCSSNTRLSKNITFIKMAHTYYKCEVSIVGYDDEKTLVIK